MGNLERRGNRRWEFSNRNFCSEDLRMCWQFNGGSGLRLRNEIEKHELSRLLQFRAIGKSITFWQHFPLHYWAIVQYTMSLLHIFARQSSAAVLSLLGKTAILQPSIKAIGFWLKTHACGFCPQGRKKIYRNSGASTTPHKSNLGVLRILCKLWAILCCPKRLLCAPWWRSFDDSKGNAISAQYHNACRFRPFRTTLKLNWNVPFRICEQRTNDLLWELFDDGVKNEFP